MAAFQKLLRGLRDAEQELARQLEGIRQAISTLEFGGAASPAAPRPGRRGARRRGRRLRKLSAKARKAMSDAQKRRWAKVKAPREK